MTRFNQLGIKTLAGWMIRVMNGLAGGRLFKLQ